MTKPKTLEEFRSKGGKTRASKYSKERLSEWSSKGGRPRKVVPQIKSKV